MDKKGSIENWNPKPWINAANFLTAYDDPLLALKLLDCVPAYYRDHKDSEIEALKKKILTHIVTPGWYANAPEEVYNEEVSKNIVYGTLRGIAISNEIRELNEKGITPHIIEFAPGCFWVPMGLKALGLDFTYEALGFKSELIKPLSELINYSEDRSGKTCVYVAFEIIEHLHYENEIAVEINRTGVTPDIIHLSTPLYTFDGRRESLNWEGKDLGHLRTYTPGELLQKCGAMFPDYTWQFLKAENDVLNAVMSIKGVISGS